MVQACAQVFNDWEAEFVSYDPQRLVGVSVIPMHDVDWAIQELQRTLDKGLLGPMINCQAPVGCPPYRDPIYDRFWAVADGRVRAALPLQPEAIHALAVSPDGQTLALGCQDRTVKLWDVASRQLRAVLSGHTREVNAVAFSADGRYLVSASAANAVWWVKGGEIKVWKADR